tara:strand:+ start:1769 stop:2719 length:951 start_codon:yes stop_codon:yes gene_type:complete
LKISKKTTSIIHHANDQDWEHIFFVVNPVTVILAKLIIEKFNINRKNITIYSLRDTDISLIKGEHKHLKKSLFYRLLIKLGLTPVSREVRKSLNKKNKPFLLYCSWCFHESIATPSISRILKSKLSKGHFYIEEGQATYRPSKPFNALEKVREIHTHAEGFKQMYRDDSHGFISILEGAFPEAPIEKRLVLDNLYDLKDFYKPKLIGNRYIGLTCAQRRLKDNEWENMFKKLFKSMPHGGVIKIHPSFLMDSRKRKKIISIFYKLKEQYRNIELCDENVILEIEMLFEKKELIGSITSLEVYAKNLGSDFKKIELF